MSFSYNREKDIVTYVADGISLFPDDGSLKKRTFELYQEKGLFGMKNMCREIRTRSDIPTRDETYHAVFAWRWAKKYRNQQLRKLSKSSKEEKPLNTFTS